MAKISLISSDIRKAKCDTVVIGVASSENGPVILKSGLDKKLVTELESLIEPLGVSAKADSITRIPVSSIAANTVALVGVGSVVTPDSLAEAAGSATRSLSGDVVIAFPVFDDETLSSVAQGALMGAYRYERFKKGAPVADSIQIATESYRSKATKEALDGAQIIAESVCLARDLVNDPPRDLYPETFAKKAKEAAGSLARTKVKIFDESDLEKAGCGGLLGVGQGSVRGPRLVRVEYSPSRPTRHVALVGKGITFDTGGISIKRAAGMEEMKSDMGGAAAVLGAVVAAARLELPVRVTGWLCCAENMPGGNAQRPADVITIRGGKTVEVLNTDAEGRLVLADGLVSACLEEPDCVIDIATLTGAQIVALGERTAGVMGTTALREEVTTAGMRAGEALWSMPFPKELRAGLDSDIADLKNIGNRSAGMMTAGVFLGEFVGDTPWAHIDIAGPAFNAKGAYGYTTKGGTGAGVRTLVSFLKGEND